jgi:hypothetical protein
MTKDQFVKLGILVLLVVGAINMLAGVSNLEHGDASLAGDQMFKAAGWCAIAALIHHIRTHR